jgi:antagonist of KipI
LSILIIKPGFQTTVQDLGRVGFKKSGVPESGCMDQFSSRLANILCGNNPSEALLEMVLHGVEILTLSPLVVVFSGGGAQPVINQQYIPFNRPIFIPANTHIRTLPHSVGMRLYMAIGGGIDVPLVMGSRSTYLPAGAGIPCISGSILAIRKSSKLTENILQPLAIALHTISFSHWGYLPQHTAIHSKIIRIMEGPEWHLFTLNAQRECIFQPFTILPQSNRMGYRLHGKPLELIEKVEMISTAVTKGTIQVTPNGSLFILMADAQTTGGYPRIAQVIETDINTLAQIKPGDNIHFVMISLFEAMKINAGIENVLFKIRKSVELKFH